MKEITYTVKFPKIVVWRAKLFTRIVRFAVWVGGFGGVDFVEQGDSHLTPTALDPLAADETAGEKVEEN